MTPGLINAAAGTWLENPFKGVAGTPSPGMDISAEIAAFKAANPTLGSHYNKATNTTTNNAGKVIANIGGPAAGTGGLEPNPNAQIEPFGNSRQPSGPGQAGWVNGKVDPNLQTAQQGSGATSTATPGTGGGSPYEPGNTGSSVNLPAGWGSMGAAEKVNWFNQNNTSINALKQSGVTDAEIAWMKQNGYTGGTGNTTDANATEMANKVGYKLPEGWGGFTPEQKINWYNTNNAKPSTLLAAGVTQAEIDWMKAHGYNVQDETTTGTGPGTSSGSSGQGTWNVTPNQTVASQFASLTDPNSALMQQARARAMQGMNSRGIVNSSMAQTAADSAMYDAAMPIAKQDAATYADAGKTNAGFTQQWNINEKNNQLQREMQQASIAAQAALQSGSIQAQQALQQASQTFQGLQNGSSNATQIYAWLNDQIASIYKSDLSTDAKQKLVDQLTAQANSSLASIATLTQTLVSGAQALGLPPKK